MKKYVKFLTIIVIFVMMIGINVNAEDYDLYSDGASIKITMPIHKTDKEGKALKGAIFTLKDFNNKISYSSSDEGDGDYLIEVNAGYEISATLREQVDQNYRINDEYSDDNTLMKILDIMPSKYSDVIRNAQSADDLYDMLDLPIAYSDSYENGYYVEFFVPLKIEESKVPAGYKAKNIVVPAYVSIDFDDYKDDGNYGYIWMNLSSAPGSFGASGVPAYFEYSDGVDYVALFDKINNELFESNYNETIDVFEKNGAIIDDDCDIQLPPSREDLEERFSDDIEENYCPINLVDEKEDIIVNPETAGTIGIVALLLVIGLSVIFYTRRVKSN